MRLRVSIPRVEPGVMEVPDVCPYDDCDGRYFKPHQQNCDKSLRDTKYDQVNAMRRECLRCGRTHRVYPKGVSGAHHSDRLKGLSVLLYLLGLSYGAVEDALAALEWFLGKTTVWRNVQAAGEKVRELRQAWLQGQAGKVRVVGGDPTHVRCGGEDVVVGVAVDDERGITLDIVLLENERTETLKTWLLPLLDLVGAEVLTTDDADGFKEVADEAGVHHQICRRHVTNNVLTFIAEVAEQVWEGPPPVLEELTISLDQLLVDRVVGVDYAGTSRTRGETVGGNVSPLCSCACSQKGGTRYGLVSHAQSHLAPVEQLGPPHVLSCHAAQRGFGNKRYEQRF